MLISGGYAKGHDLLALVLPQLVVRIGNLEPIPRGEDIDVKSIPPGRIIVEMIEDGAN